MGPVVEFIHEGTKMIGQMNPINLTHLHPNLDPGGSTRAEIGCKSGLFIKYIIGLKQNLNSFLGQPDSI